MDRAAASPAPRVLGLDPGSAATGYGVVEPRPGGRGLVLVACGVIRPPARRPFPLRLQAIHQGLGRVIREHRPAEAAVEGVFAAKNIASALKLGQARGVALLAAAQEDLEIFEYTPAAVKKALVGVGRADKEQVRAMVAALLKVKASMPLDASDALAVAITHLHSRKLGNL